MKRAPFYHLALAFMAMLAAALSAHAHDRTTSYSTWELSPQQAKVVLNVSEVEVTALALPADDASAPDAALAQYALQHLVMMAGDQPCKVDQRPRRLDAAAGRILLEWSVACPTKGALSIRSDLFFDGWPGHLHFVNLRHQDRATQHVLTSADRTWELGVEGRVADVVASSTSLGTYWTLGMEHIATGYDHLVFLLALLLSGGTFASMVKVVTGFTVGHSITLGLAALGLVRPEIGPIEALIGLSIGLVAVENIWLLGPRKYFLPAVIILLLILQALGALGGLGRISSLSCLGLAVFLSCYYPLLRQNPHLRSARWTVALLFGLIHGFSFASVLRAAGLPPERLPAVLVSFNLGVETGQVVVVALAWPLLRLALLRWGALVVEVGSAVALALGLYWFVDRTYP